jgi:transposase InsO family protein
MSGRQNDICTITKLHYWITFLDDRTKLHAVHFLKCKSDAFDAFKMFKANAENQVNAKIKALQDDKGGEYMSAAFLKFTDQCGITRRHSTRNHPQQNGVAERANRTISDHATAMLNESNLPASFWAYAVSAYIHVWNRIPTSPLPGTTSYTAWFNKKPDISHFRVFGCTAYVYTCVAGHCLAWQYESLHKLNLTVVINVKTVLPCEAMAY